MTRIACIGECMVELSNAGDSGLRQGFAGDTANLAVYLARLLPETTVSYVTAIGEDELSDAMLAAWQAEQIDTSQVRRLAERLPGLYWIRTTADGERRFLYWRGESAARELFRDGYANELEQQLRGTGLICLSGISLAILTAEHRAELIDLLGRLRSSGSRIAFDSNYRAALWPDTDAARDCYEQILRITDCALVSQDDERQLFHAAAPADTIQRLTALGVREVVVRCGAQPCLIDHDGQRMEVAPPEVAKAVDTTAAGDSFNAAYLAARLTGLDCEAAALAGHRLAGLVVGHRGAILPRTSMPVAQLLFGTA
ncbi:MAG: sugar kinase [Gammaproteobacteria bacterium]|nr:sugar kinase [Gammaproteobacteria bacterium]